MYYDMTTDETCADWGFINALESMARVAAYKFRLCRFAASRETFRSAECHRPIRARYSGRAVFAIA